MKPITSLLRALDIYKIEQDAGLLEEIKEILEELDKDLFSGEYEPSVIALQRYRKFDDYLDLTYISEDEYDDYEDEDDDDDYDEDILEDDDFTE